MSFSVWPVKQTRLLSMEIRQPDSLKTNRKNHIYVQRKRRQKIDHTHHHSPVTLTVNQLHSINMVCRSKYLTYIILSLENKGFEKNLKTKNVFSSCTALKSVTRNIWIITNKYESLKERLNIFVLIIKIIQRPSFVNQINLMCPK